MKKLTLEPLNKLNSFKKLHTSKLMISRVQTIPRVKMMQTVVEELKNQDRRKEIIVKKDITSYKSGKKNQKCLFEIIYVNDKICMATFREILDMKLLFKILCSRLSFLNKQDMRRLALKWFHSDNPSFTEDDNTQENLVLEEAERTSQKNPINLSLFVDISQIQENQNQASENLSNDDENNMSQFSEFSQEFNNFRKMDLNFFNF